MQKMRGALPKGLAGATDAAVGLVNCSICRAGVNNRARAPFRGLLIVVISSESTNEL